MTKGKQLLINADCENHLMYNSVYRVYELLETLIKQFKRLTPPFVIRGTENSPGLTAFIIIDSSHISFHSFKDEKRIRIDIYSGKDFEHEMIIRFLKSEFRSKNFEWEIIER